MTYAGVSQEHSFQKSWMKECLSYKCKGPFTRLAHIQYYKLSKVNTSKTDKFLPLSIHQ